jgi:membrane-associated phospholipid phosphatase
VPPLYAHDPFLVIQGALATPWLDGPMATLSVSCEGWALGILVALMALWFEKQPRRAVRAALPALVALAVGGIVVAVVKHLLALPRPAAVLGEQRVRVLLEPLLYNSFPSGHAVALGIVAAYFTGRYGWQAAPLWLFAVAGAMARVYVGAHWTIDVAAGLGIGSLIGLGAWMITRRASRAPAAPSLCPDGLEQTVAGDPT